MTTRISSGLWAATTTWQELTERLLERVERYHAHHPLKPGIAREELRSQLAVEPPVFAALLEQLHSAGQIVIKGQMVRDPAFTITFTLEQLRALDAFWRAVDEAPTAPPNVKTAIEMLGEGVFSALQARGDIVLVENGVFFDRETFEAMEREVIALIRERGGVTVADVRDHFQTSRKYVLGLLEYLDEKQVTRRQGDLRLLRGEKDLPG